MNNTALAPSPHETDSSITYHNKDITAKLLTDGLKGKTLKIYGLPELKIVDILPTNLPAIEANELRIDNLLLFSDGSVGILDYESSYTWEDRIKYVNYVARILKRYVREGTIQKLKRIRLIIIFTADIEKVDNPIIDIGCMKVCIEPAYLIGIDTNKVWQHLKNKIDQKWPLTDEELMNLIILPLTIKGTKSKQKLAVETINLAKKLPDENQQLYAISGILTFSDKFIDKEFAKKVRENIMTLKVVQLILDEGRAEGKIEGKMEEQIEIVRSMLEMKYDNESIAKVTKLSVTEILEIKNSL